MMVEVNDNVDVYNNDGDDSSLVEKNADTSTSVTFDLVL